MRTRNALKKVTKKSWNLVGCLFIVIIILTDLVMHGMNTCNMKLQYILIYGLISREIVLDSFSLMPLSGRFFVWEPV